METTKKWSQHVTETSDAMDVARGTLSSRNPKRIAEALERDAEKSTRRKTTPYRSAMSMLTFYINRAGKNLPATQRKILEQAKEILRAEYGSDVGAAKKQSGEKKATAKRPARKRSS
jgi:putative cell wall-binding protein